MQKGLMLGESNLISVKRHKFIIFLEDFVVFNLIFGVLPRKPSISTDVHDRQRKLKFINFSHLNLGLSFWDYLL